MQSLNNKLYEMTPEDVANIYKRIFDTPDGKLMLEDLKNRCYVKISSIDEHNGRTYFNEGMRAVVLHIESQISYIPGADDAVTEGRE